MSKPYLSIRWKIILLSSLVLGMTSSLFIWQRYTVEINELELTQAEFHEHSRKIVHHLFRSQAERMQMLAAMLVEQPNVREDILNRREDRLVRVLAGVSPEFSIDQGVMTVAFQDAGQKVLSVWGESAYIDKLDTLARLSVTQEQPQFHLTCRQACVHQTVIPVSYRGKTVGSISLVSSLEFILNDLHRLSGADVAVLYGNRQSDGSPIAGMRVVSVSGGEPMREVLEAGKQGLWADGRFIYRHAAQVHQLMLLPGSLSGSDYVHFAVISDVGRQIQEINKESIHSLLWGALILSLAILFLYAMLRPTMRRIHHVSQILPLLGEEKFSQVREYYANRPVTKWMGSRWNDEADELESLALVLAGQLEQLQAESIAHYESIRIQAGELKHERDFLSGLLDTAPVFILSYDDEGRIQMANAAAMQLSGLTKVAGEDYASVFLGISHDAYAAEMSKMKVGEVHRMEATLFQCDESLHHVLWFHSRLSVGISAAPIYLSVGMDVTERRKSEAKIHDLAFYDVLTKLPNRRKLTGSVQHAMRSSLRAKTGCALVYIDLDGFKKINDGKGREIGDTLLIETARRLRSCVRGFDTVAHLGGDEFVVLLEELSGDTERVAAQASLIAEKLRAVIRQPSEVQGITFHLTSSAGVVLFGGTDVSVDELLRHANIAMSHAKASGRNALRFFDREMQSSLEKRAELEADLYLALENKQFHLYYQIQMNGEGKPLGAEALIRWIHPARGMVSPMQFIPLAEETELILPIGLWVLETACAQLKAWEADGQTRDLQLAINVSARQFYQLDFVETVQSTLERFAVNPARLKLELTESMVLEDVADVISKMHRLKEIGVFLSIDDFGTAYSSLAYLTKLPVDQLKIDQSFVRNIGVKENDGVVVRTIINMANHLNMDVIAEGVETHDQREFLAEAGCYAYQGYLYSKPLAADAFSALLKSYSV